MLFLFSLILDQFEIKFKESDVISRRNHNETAIIEDNCLQTIQTVVQKIMDDDL